MGVRVTTVLKHKLEDGIAATRTFLPLCWIDRERCDRGIQSLMEYQKMSIEGERGPDGEMIYRDRPAHTWASHGADALRYLAMGLRPDRSKDFRQPQSVGVA